MERTGRSGTPTPGFPSNNNNNNDKAPDSRPILDDYDDDGQHSDASSTSTSSSIRRGGHRPGSVQRTSSSKRASSSSFLGGKTFDPETLRSIAGRSARRSAAGYQAMGHEDGDADDAEGGDDEGSDLDLDFELDYRRHHQRNHNNTSADQQASRRSSVDSTASLSTRVPLTPADTNGHHSRKYSVDSSGGSGVEDHLFIDYAEEEEHVGMMTGSRVQRAGEARGPGRGGVGGGGEGGSGHGHGSGSLEPKLPHEGGSLFNSFLNMANSIVGAGIIGLPFAFQEAGLGMGIIILCALTWTVDWTVGLLVHVGKLSGRTSYQDIMMFCFGKAGLIAISIFQFVFAFGAMCAYTVIVGDTIPHVIQALFPPIVDIPVLNVLVQRASIIIICTVFISFPLSLYRDISKLAKTSAVAMVALIVIIVAVVIEGPRADPEIRGDPQAAFTFIRPQIFQAIGVISFAFVCHHNTFIIFGSLQKPTINRVSLVTHMSMFVSLLACMILALAGFLSFTDKTTGNILNNFPSDNFLINIARFCFGVNMFTTFPLENFVCREVIEAYYFPDRPFSMKRHVAITVGLVGVSLGIALSTCNLGFVLELTGGFSAIALAFILPPLCYLKLASGPIVQWRKAPHLACILFGIAIMTLSTGLSLVHFWNAPSTSDQKC
ncbi:hypothetical protein DFQ27_008776 [Actinomortierella ambigua]|uniref:Amino acid transporter transmembrane domain-containing protein n=1 Tax=Actinomortierella ambigua TaxID=1343610 RepID=A0A9P6PSW2_9FUNG|nr:hypothetical protein DFQ27_008776 [Actinomortierella ambigua]